jgi:erythromycin esterase-like protein
MIDLSAILEQHERSEKLARRKLFPAIRVTGFDEVDQEAAALCDAIDGVEPRAVSRATVRREDMSCTHRLEW